MNKEAKKGRPRYTEKTIVWLDKEMRRELEARAQMQERSISWVIREALKKAYGWK